MGDRAEDHGNLLCRQLGSHLVRLCAAVDHEVEPEFLGQAHRAADVGYGIRLYARRHPTPQHLKQRVHPGLVPRCGRPRALGLGTSVVRATSLVVLLRADERLAKERHDRGMRVGRPVPGPKGLRRTTPERDLHAGRFAQYDRVEARSCGLHDGALTADDRRVAWPDVLRRDTADEQFPRPKRPRATDEPFARWIVSRERPDLGRYRIGGFSEILRVDAEVRHRVDEAGHHVLPRRVDDRRAGRYGDVGADGGDLAAADQHDAALDGRPCHREHRAAADRDRRPLLCLDGRGDRRDRRGGYAEPNWLRRAHHLSSFARS
jgi:hypothetical protein